MEIIVNNHLVRYLESNDLLNDRQDDLRRKRSARELIAILSELWSQSIHRLGKSKVAALDFTKVFERICQDALLSMLVVSLDLYRCRFSFALSYFQ